MTSQAALGAFLLLALSCAGPALPAPGTAPPASKRQPAKAQARQQGSDAEIERAIRARFARSKIATDNFQVHVQGGIATLEGTTEVVQHKGVATRLAKSSGASAVDNRIRPTEQARQKAAASLAKGRRRAQIKRAEVRSATPQPRTGR
jgi:osmotically-inducible protein OsmY